MPATAKAAGDERRYEGREHRGRPMEDSMDKVPMTTTGHAALTEEYRRRTAEDRRRIIDAISEARAHGDLSENAEYHAAKEQQSLNEGRIQELESLLALADIIDVKKLSGTTVKFGATVTIVDEDTDEERAYQIVGDPEADAGAGRISVSSPIARAMIGKSVGDSFEVSAPGGSRSYEILAVKFA
jgi:transcription elongation factor GreA